MKRLYLLLLSFACLSSYSQDRIGYSYIAGGYRTGREVIMSVPQPKAKKHLFNSRSQMYSEQLNGHTIELHPNPTHGVLRVFISDRSQADKCFIDVYSTQGARILTCNAHTGNVDIDISNQPNGIYMLRITINDKTAVWRIIKK